MFLCPSDQTNPNGLADAGATLGSYGYSLYEPAVPASGVFPQFTSPAIELPLEAAMSDGTSTTIIVGEHVRFCGGGVGGGGGLLGGENSVGNNRQQAISGQHGGWRPRAIVTGVNPSLCVAPPAPPAGVSVFSTGHVGIINFLMGDGAVKSCSASIDVAGVLVPALTARAGDTGGDL